MLTVEARSIGRSRALFSDWAVPPPPGLGGGGDGYGPTKLRDVITHIVREEVEAYTRRAEARRLDRVLSSTQISEQLRAGKVSPEGKAVRAEVNPEAAVDTALQAFEDGLYLVVIDGEEHRDLDALVRLGPDSRICFLRLTFLAGA